MQPIAGLLCGVLLVGITSASADDSKFSRSSLKGLKSVAVSVSRTSTDEDYGFLNDEDIKTAVETKLRMARLPITESHSVLQENGAFLSVNVGVIHPSEAEGTVYVFHLELAIEQPTLLIRNPSIVVPLGVTWSIGTTGFLGKANLRSIRDQLNDLTDRFINAYLLENPR